MLFQKLTTMLLNSGMIEIGTLSYMLYIFMLYALDIILISNNIKSLTWHNTVKRSRSSTINQAILAILLSYLLFIVCVIDLYILSKVFDSTASLTVFFKRSIIASNRISPSLLHSATDLSISLVISFLSLYYITRHIVNSSSITSVESCDLYIIFSIRRKYLA